MTTAGRLTLVYAEAGRKYYGARELIPNHFPYCGPPEILPVLQAFFSRVAV